MSPTHIRSTLLLIALLFLLMGMPAWAETPSIREGETLSLSRCIEIALKRHPDLAAYAYEVEARAAQAAQARKEYFPKLDVTGGYTRFNPNDKNTADAYTQIPPDSYSYYSAAATLTQNIYDFGKRETNVRIKDLSREASLHDLEDRRVSVIHSVREAYYDLLRTSRNRDVQTEKVGRFESHLRQAKTYFEAGTKSRYDVTKAEVDLSNARLELTTAENDEMLARVSLNQVMGLPSPPPYRIEDNLAFLRYDVVLADALARALEAREDLKSLASQIEMEERGIDLARKEYLPSLSGKAAYSYEGSERPLSRGWNAGVSVSVNFFEGLATQNRIREALAKRNKLQAQLDAKRLEVRTEIQKAYLNLGKAERTITDAALATRQAEENLEIVTLKYSAGLSTPVEVTDATVGYSDAKLKHIQALYDYRKARSAIEKAMGMKQ
ncbi:MAG: TolC family protein [Syntrophaceae bacterium]|nr:TolC family protein [Syntrophaceae bacterium]